MFRHKDSIIIFCAFCGHKATSTESAYVTESERRTTYVETRGASADRHRRERKEEHRRRAKSSGAAMEFGKAKNRRATTSESTSFEINKKARASKGSSMSQEVGAKKKASDNAGSAEIQIEESLNRGAGTANSSKLGTGSSSAQGASSASGNADMSKLGSESVPKSDKLASSSTAILSEKKDSQAGSAMSKTSNLGGKDGSGLSELGKSSMAAGSSGHEKKNKASGSSADVQIEESLNRATTPKSKKDADQSNTSQSGKSSKPAESRNQETGSNSKIANDSSLASDKTSSPVTSHATEHKKTRHETTHVHVQESVSKADIGSSMKPSSNDLNSGVTKSSAMLAQNTSGLSKSADKSDIGSKSASNVPGSSKSSATAGSSLLSSKKNKSENTADVQIEESLNRAGVDGPSNTADNGKKSGEAKSSSHMGETSTSVNKKIATKTHMGSGVESKKMLTTTTSHYTIEHKKSQAGTGPTTHMLKASALGAKSTSGLEGASSLSAQDKARKGTSDSADVNIGESLKRTEIVKSGKDNSTSGSDAINVSGAEDARKTFDNSAGHRDIVHKNNRHVTQSSHVHVQESIANSTKKDATHDKDSGNTNASVIGGSQTMSASGLSKQDKLGEQNVKSKTHGITANVEIEESLKRGFAKDAQKSSANSNLSGSIDTANAINKSDVDSGKHEKKVGASSTAISTEYNKIHASRDNESGQHKRFTTGTTNASSVARSANIDESVMISGNAASSTSPKNDELVRKKKKRKYRYTTTTTTLTAERARQEEERRRLSQIHSTDLNGSRVSNPAVNSTSSKSPGSAAASVSMNISATKSASSHSPRPSYDDYQKKKKKKDV